MLFYRLYDIIFCIAFNAVLKDDYRIWCMQQ